MEYIAFDSHKRYTIAAVEPADQAGAAQTFRVPHERGKIAEFLARFTPGSPVAVEAMGNWYWILDEIEAAGMEPRLVHPRKAKLMMGCINKTDKLDAHGINLLQRNGTLPKVWIPPVEVRDQRDLPRTRMVLVQQRTQLKNRIHATLAKYALHVDEVSDLFGKKGTEILRERIQGLPPHTRFSCERMLEHLGSVCGEIEAFEERMAEVFGSSPEREHLKTIPGIGDILSVVILVEIGDVQRFPSAERLAAYAGTVPRVHASGGKIRIGRLRPDVNHYLKWAFMEAANGIARNRRSRPYLHVSRLYERIRERRGHPKAVGAVARHLAEATYWILTKKEPYRQPHSKPVSSKKA